MYTRIIYVAVLYLIGQFSYAQINDELKSVNPIPVLNMGTFHMGHTPDSNRTDFDEYNKKNKEMIHEVAEAIATFKPTVILVEQLPKYNQELNDLYDGYVKNPAIAIQNPNEIHLLAFELGRLAGVQKIYGIDYSEGYNYLVSKKIPSYNDKELYDDYITSCLAFLGEKNQGDLNVKQMLYNINTKKELDAVLNLNADMLTHVSTPGKSEGADEAAKYYHRNLVMYSNLNQIPLTKDDRVFILMGATHTAFFNMWLERSPKYQLMNTLDYLKK